jgi:hypothetical protein
MNFKKIYNLMGHSTRYFYIRIVIYIKQYECTEEDDIGEKIAQKKPAEFSGKGCLSSTGLQGSEKEIRYAFCSH